MFVKPIIIMLAILCVGCASQLKSSEPLSDTFSVKTFDEKEKVYREEVAKVERLEKVDGSKHIKLSIKGGHNTFSANYADEYIYYIDQFLSMEDMKGSQETYLGDSHTFSDLARNKFSVVSESENYLRVEPCSFGHCNSYGVVYYDKAEALKLRDYILEFQTEYGEVLQLFEPSLPNKEKARVYFYRLNSAPLASKAPIEINKKKMFKLPANKCVWFDVSPGEYEISSNMLMVAGAEAKFVFSGGEAYFVKFTSVLSDQKKKPDYALNSMMNIFYDRNSLKIEPLVVAKYDISICDPIDNEL